MTLLERYKSGETIEVYNEIYKLGEKAFEKDKFQEIEAVLVETMERVKYNLEIIHDALININYLLKSEYECTSDYPIAKPLKNIDKLLNKLDKLVKPFGYVPLSVKTFFKIAGSCNFVWNYETNDNLTWEYADPIQINAIDDIIEEMINGEWTDMMRENLEDEDFENQSAYIEFSADYYHKDNASGGRPYAIEITTKPSIDSQVLFEEHQTTFINYLRLCFDNCGFLRIKETGYNNDFEKFFDLVKPRLKEI